MSKRAGFRSGVFAALCAFGMAAVYLLTGSSADAAAGRKFSLTLRDSLTGRYISGGFGASDGRVAASGRTDAAGDGNAMLSPGIYQISAQAAGYNDLASHFEISDTDLSVTAWLDPLIVESEMQPELIASKIKSGSIFIHGHIYDENGAAVKGAEVRLAEHDGTSLSDEKGYFQMSTPVPPVDPRGDLPATDDVTVSVGGKSIYRRKNVLLSEGATHLIIDVNRNSFKEFDATHKLKLSREELGQTQYERPQTDDISYAPDRPAAVSVPTSIRVGSSCPTKTTCSVFNVYSLDTYTRLGLDDEWISSWNTNSLKAGAIAYRTYGVYHVFHPLTANYDICNTTSCQVLDPADSSTAVDTATAQTTGSIVVDSTGTAAFFAEYAAENNANLCPDGQTGNNGSWPCMADPVDAGQTFNGHGRGMCQWGTQRWAVNQGKDFVWIVNHYYNNNGSPSGLRTGILQASPNSVLPPPDLGSPGVSNAAPGTTISTTTPTFQWTAVDGADGYGLYISKFNGSTYDLVYNSETAVGQPITGNSFMLPSGVLTMNAQYRWNMSTHNAAGYGSANTFRTYFAVSPPVTVSGRVLMPAGTGLKNATVSIRDTSDTVRRVLTNSFGLFGFDNVTPGQTYTVSVSSKRYRFASQTVQVDANFTTQDFVGQE